MARKRSNIRIFNKRKYVYSGYVYATKSKAGEIATEFRKEGFLARLVPIQFKKKKYWQVFYSVKN